MPVKTLVMASILVATFGAQAEITHTIERFDREFVELLDEGLNYKDEDSDGFTEVNTTDDGYLLEIESKDHSDRIDMVARFQSDSHSWFQMTWDRLEINGAEISIPTGFPKSNEAEQLFASTWVRFDPWNSPTGFGLANSPHTFAFPSGVNSIQFLSPDCPECVIIPDGGYSLFFEYSIEEIEPPLHADFNYDGEIDFSDFLILSEYFERNPGSPRRIKHFYGDANLDGFTNFTDFLILSESFGTSREAAAVPEPSGAALLALALVCLAGLRRRRI